MNKTTDEQQRLITEAVKRQRKPRESLEMMARRLGIGPKTFQRIRNDGYFPSEKELDNLHIPILLWEAAGLQQTSRLPSGLPSAICSADIFADELYDLSTRTSPMRLPQLRVDGCFELLHSYCYRGWSVENIDFKTAKDPAVLAPDLEHLCESHPERRPNNPKLQLVGLGPYSSETALSIRFAPTSYFKTRPIQRFLNEPVLIDISGQEITPLKKYGAKLLHFDNCELPSPVACVIIVALRGNLLLLGQRAAQTDLDWGRGKWACSIDEQMSGPPLPDTSEDRPIDITFFDTIKRGIEEEIGVEALDRIREIRILSLIFGSNLFVSAVALVELDMDIDQVKECDPLDGQAEIRQISCVDWTIEALAPVLYRRTIDVSGASIGPTDWDNTSRMRILASLYYKYRDIGIEGVNRRLRLLA
ncbi:MAG: hypothetical protein KIT43_13005 [Bauldia sp.]|nr:hypothetical protein [Bauldia sp.]MCW5717060.1 hypothetical protein [Bauldia sp.]